MKLTPLKISQLITVLQKAKQELGDLPVYLSSDEEGNSFSRVFKEGVSPWEDKEGICLYPLETEEVL